MIAQNLFKVVVAFALISVGCINVTCCQHDFPDIDPLRDAIKNWYTAWETKDVDLAVQDYAWDCDWTNAFGARVQSQDELKVLLTEIFNMDFVMAGQSENTMNDFTFLTSDIAYVRSQTVRKGQLQSDGVEMDDRVINHLRIFWRTDGEWKITSHLISQAWPKR
jgi:ketosteroid isomerase-like protein